jgi:Flp pilus assembly protein CpaB
MHRRSFDSTGWRGRSLTGESTVVNTLKYMGVAAVSFVVAAFLFFVFLQRLNARAAAAISDRHEAVVLVSQAEPGQPLSADMLELRRLPPSDIPDNAVRDVEQALGRTAAVRLFPGETLLAERLGDVERLSAAGSVARGRVAFSVAAKPHTSVAALIAPGDRIDVLGRLGSEAPIESAARHEPPLRLLVSDVRVVGESGKPPLAEADVAVVSAEEPDATPTPRPENEPRIFVLDVSPEEAVTLAEAMDTGTVYFALRSSRTR